MHLYQAREVMEELKEAILLSKKGFTRQERLDALYVLTRLEEFVEAGFIIARKEIDDAKQNEYVDTVFVSDDFENELRFEED